MAKQYIEGFPKTQAEMAEWQSKYKFDPIAKKWYIPDTTTEVSVTPTLENIGAKIQEIKRQTEELAKKVTSATQLRNTPSFPEISYEESKPKTAIEAIQNINNLVSTDNAVLQYLLKRDEELRKQAEEEKKESQSWLEKILAKPEKTQEEKLAELRQQYNIPQMIDLIQQQTLKVTQLQNQIDQLNAREREEIEKQYERTVPLPMIENQVREIQRQYDSQRAKISAQLGAEAALLQAYQGNLQLARDLIEESIKAYMYDYEEQQNRFKAFYTYHSDLYKSLNREDREIIDQALALLTKEKAEKEQEKREVGELMLKYPQAGITLNDSKDEAIKKASIYLKSQPPQEKITDETRINEVMKFIQERVGKDGYISAETYAQALQKWIGMGGNIRDFRAVFPPEALMGEWEIPKLPSSTLRMLGVSSTEIRNEDLITR